MIYIVTNGQYSDYGIEGAFTTQAKAIALITKESDKHSWYNEYRIEVWEGDKRVKNIIVEKNGDISTKTW